MRKVKKRLENGLEKNRVGWRGVKVTGFSE